LHTAPRTRPRHPAGRRRSAPRRRPPARGSPHHALPHTHRASPSQSQTRPVTCISPP